MFNLKQFIRLEKFISFRKKCVSRNREANNQSWTMALETFVGGAEPGRQKQGRLFTLCITLQSYVLLFHLRKEDIYFTAVEVPQKPQFIQQRGRNSNCSVSLMERIPSLWLSPLLINNSCLRTPEQSIYSVTFMLYPRIAYKTLHANTSPNSFTFRILC